MVNRRKAPGGPKGRPPGERGASPRVYELTEEERTLIEGLRSGRIVLDRSGPGETWVKLSEKECEVIELLRAGEYGSVTIKFVRGEPKISKVVLEFLHGKLSERQATFELLARLGERCG